MTTGTAKNTAKKAKAKSKTNLTSGEISTATEICKIIKACKDSNVATFSYKGLELKFNSHEMEETSRQPVIVAHPEEISDNNTEYMDTKDKVDVLMNNMEEMKIIDPLAYEKFLQEEDLNHA